MRTLATLGVIVVLLATGCGQPARPTLRDRMAERSYAAEVVDAFFQTLKVDGNREQLALTTKAFQDRHEETGGVVGGWTGRSFGVKPGMERNSADGDEWLFTGPIHTNKTGDDFKGTHQIRVVKEAETGKWRVDFFTAAMRE